MVGPPLAAHQSAACDPNASTAAAANTQRADRMPCRWKRQSSPGSQYGSVHCPSGGGKETTPINSV